MAWKRCRACRGEYSDTQPDGTSYFHVCPPRHMARVRRADGSTAVVPFDQVGAGDVIVRELWRPRPNARDENTREWTEQGGRRERVIKAEGAGAEDAPAPVDE